jgi:hypothetical protein
MAVTSEHVLYVNGSAYSLKTINSFWPDPDRPTYTLVRFTTYPDKPVSILTTTFEAAYQTSLGV